MDEQETTPPEGEAAVVLVLEDDKLVSEYLTEVIQSDPDRSYAVCAVQTLADAQARLQDGNIVAAICDLNVPDSRGLATAQALLAEAPWLPLIVLTGLNDAGLGLDAVRAGAQDYIHKSQSGGSRLTDAIAFAIERKNNELSLARNALKRTYVDELTGLSTRGLLDQTWTQTKARCRRAGTGLAFLVGDLDGFKQVNDTAGHLTGDLVLQEIAVRLKKAVRSSDQIYRLGGDEFLIVLEGVRTPADVLRCTDAINLAMTPRFRANGHTFSLMISMGTCLVGPDDVEDAEVADLFQRADMAMYAAKRKRRDSGLAGF